MKSDIEAAKELDKLKKKIELIEKLDSASSTSCDIAIAINNDILKLMKVM